MSRGCFLTALFFLFCISCIDKKENDFLIGIKKIKGKLMDADCLIGRPVALVYIDSLLFIYDRYEGKTLTVLDVNGNCKNRTLSIGNGPGEISGTFRLSVSPLQKRLFVFQEQSGILNQYEINGSDLTFQESVRISERPANIVAIQDAYIGIGPFERGRYHVYDLQGTPINEIGSYPFDGERINYQTRFFLYQGYLCSQPDGIHFALGSSYSDNLEFYGIRDNKIELLKKYGSQEVKAGFDQVIKLEDNCLLGYKGSYGTERYCYMLYSGKTYSENNYRKAGANHIFVFEWNGSFVKSFRLNQEVYAFCVNEINKVFYGIVTYEGEAAIMKFEMDEK